MHTRVTATVMGTVMAQVGVELTAQPAGARTVLVRDRPLHMGNHHVVRDVFMHFSYTYI